jgi:hypothetical protein
MGKSLLNGYTDEMKKPVFSILNSSYTKEIFSPTSCVNVVFFSDMFLQPTVYIMHTFEKCVNTVLMAYTIYGLVLHWTMHSTC